MVKTFTKPEFIEMLRQIRDRGWIRSKRSPGNAGAVGNTLEDLLGIDENNLPIANTTEWEIKAQRKDTGSLITLFHLEPEPREAGVVADILLPKYGWPHKSIENEMSFRSTTSGDRYTDRGFRVRVDRQNERVEFIFDYKKVDSRHSKWLQEVKNRAGLGPFNPQPFWSFETLKKKAGDKLKNTFFIVAESKIVNKNEEFWYNHVWMLKSFSFGKFLDGLENGLVLIDFDARTGHNHGTKFRIGQSNWERFYESKEMIF